MSAPPPSPRKHLTHSASPCSRAGFWQPVSGPRKRVPVLPPSAGGSSGDEDDDEGEGALDEEPGSGGSTEAAAAAHRIDFDGSLAVRALPRGACPPSSPSRWVPSLVSLAVGALPRGGCPPSRCVPSLAVRALPRGACPPSRCVPSLAVGALPRASRAGAPQPPPTHARRALSRPPPAQAELDAQERSGDPTAEGVIWPR